MGNRLGHLGIERLAGEVEARPVEHALAGGGAVFVALAIASSVIWMVPWWMARLARLSRILCALTDSSGFMCCGCMNQRGS